MKHLLPPLLLILVVGLVAYRTLARPEREHARIRIETYWERNDKESLELVVQRTGEYLADFSSEEDRRWAAHAYLRGRRLDKAVRARWVDLRGTLPPAEVKDFAREALVVFGWDDEARQKPSVQNTMAVLALLEGGDADTKRWIEARIAREPIEEVYVFMRRSMRLRFTSAQTTLAQACRARAQAEGREGTPDRTWSLVAALLAFGREPYPEKEADMALLIDVLRGPFRVQFPPRWTLACRALGSSEDPRALGALRAVAEGLAASPDARDREDLALVQLALMAGGDWSGQGGVLAEFERKDERGEPANRVLRMLCPEVLVDRSQRGDARAQPVLNDLWSGPGASNIALREILARGLLLGPTLPGPEVPVDEMLADLEAPGAPSLLVALAKSFRVRRGEPGARDDLVRWLAFDTGSGLADPSDQERASSPLFVALRALYLYD